MTLLCFTAHIASSVAAPYQKTVTAEKVQQYIIYPPIQGEGLPVIAERFSLPVSTLSSTVPPPCVETSLQLKVAPIANTARYDRLRTTDEENCNA